ncbi:MAG: DEAD/DEAH box helicase family protein, partial [Anaeroplasmataceae bacterium]|nr:DEAD/DEAH box helicase family protein [Anaeroplasmataceae bacterium]
IKYSSDKKDSMVKSNCLLSKRFYELLDYQFLIREKVINFVSNNIEKKKQHINKLIIHMPTGTGKTKTSVHTIIALFEKYDNKGNIVWLAHTEELLDQARNAFINAWNALGNREIKVIINDVTQHYDNNAIYFISYQKLISYYKNGFDMYKKFRENMSICVCDEAHKCLATETYYALDDFMISYNENHPKTLIGLTATPGRKYKDSLLEGDNLDLALMFDQNIFSINTNELEVFSNYHRNYDFEGFSYKGIYKKDDEIIKYFQNRKVLAKIKRFPLKYDYSKIDNSVFIKKRASDYSQSELKMIGENRYRNEVIIENLKKIAARGLPTIVFACSNQQGKILSNVLTLNGIKNNCIFGDTHESLRKKYIEDFENGEYNILINNAILTTGFDSPRIKCVFITRPTNSIVLYSQMLGRGLRGKKMGGNEECLLIDVVDNLNKFNDENFAFNYFSVYWR